MTSDSRLNILLDYQSIRDYTHSLHSPLAILRADLAEAFHDTRKSFVIISPLLTLIALETPYYKHDNKHFRVLKILYANGNISLLQPHIIKYLSIRKKNAIKHVYYFHADKWHLVPIKRFLKHSSSPQA